MKSHKRVISTIMTLSSPMIIHENVINIALISMLLPSHQRLDEQVDICVHVGHPSSLLQQVFFCKCIIHYLLIRSRLHTQPFCSSEINSNRIIFSWDY